MDPSCSSPTDPTELGATECDDGIDNDGDGRTDLSDDGCLAQGDATESPACDDGIDNDGDGLVDSADPGCRMGWVDREMAACADGVDNDGDGLVDFPNDPDCADVNGREIDADPSKLVLLVDAPGEPAADGKVYDWDFGDLYRVAPDGSRTLVVTRAGDGAGRVIDDGFGPLVDRQGNLYVGGFRSANAWRLSPGGVLEQLIGPRDQGQDVHLFTGGLALGADDSLYVRSWSLALENIFRVDPSGEVTLAYDAARLGTGVRHHDVGLDGTLYLTVKDFLAQPLRDRVISLSPSGEIRTLIDERGDGVHPLDDPGEVKVDARGNVWVVGERSDNLFRITPDGTVTQMIDREGDRAGNRLNFPQTLALDRRGNAWIHGWGSRNLFLVTRGGAVLEVAQTQRDVLWAVPTHDDEILVTDTQQTWVYDRDPECSNGLDDDGDGLTDFPADPGCGSARADLEDPQCDDGIDNDEDGDTDGADSQCASPADATEGCGLGPELVPLLPGLWWLRGRRRPSPG